MHKMYFGNIFLFSLCYFVNGYKILDQDSRRMQKLENTAAVSPAAPNNTNANCPSGSYNTSASMIYSPNYPNQYDNNQNCLYVITVPDGQIVRLKFTCMYTEYKYDKVEVFDGALSDKKLLGTHSGAEMPPEYYSSENVLTVRFTSDAKYTYKGFSANYYGVVNSTTVSSTAKP